MANRGEEAADAVVAPLLRYAATSSDPDVQSLARDFAPQLRSWLPGQAANDIAATALTTCEIGEVTSWTPVFDSTLASPTQVLSVVKHLASLLSLDRDAVAIIAEVAETIVWPAGEDGDPFLTEVSEALLQIPWAAATCSQRLAVSQAAAALANLVGESRADALVLADLLQGVPAIIAAPDVEAELGVVITHLGPGSLMTLDASVAAAADGASPPVNARAALIRLTLRSKAGSELHRLDLRVVADAVKSGIEAGTAEAKDAAGDLFSSWLEQHDTIEKDVVAYLRLGRTVWTDALASWSVRQTPIKRANVWLAAARRSYPEETMGAVAKAPLEPTRVGKYLADQASSPDAQRRIRAERLARTLPLKRNDSRAVATEVAHALLAHGDVSDRTRALKLLAGNEPRQIGADLKAAIQSLPKSALDRLPKPAKGLLGRWGILADDAPPKARRRKRR